MRPALATAGVFCAAALVSGALSPSSADPVLDPSSPPQETVGKAAAGDPKPYRAEITGNCDGGSQCIVSFGKKQKERTISLVNCAAGVANGLSVLAEVRLSDPEAVVGYMGQISKAAAGGGEYAVYEYPHRFVVAAGRKMTVVVSAVGEVFATRCIVDGTIE
jgi:hypothetical protein